MPFNGSGIFVRTRSWTTDRNGGVKIRADLHDQEDDGFATGLTNCITKDGQTTITANIPFNNKRLTGLGDATAATDALNRQTADARYLDVMPEVIVSTDTISGDSSPIDVPFSGGYSAYIWEIADFVPSNNSSTITFQILSAAGTAIAGTNYSYSGISTTDTGASVGSINASAQVGISMGSLYNDAASFNFFRFHLLAKPHAASTLMPFHFKAVARNSDSTRRYFDVGGAIGGGTANTLPYGMRLSLAAGTVTRGKWRLLGVKGW